VPVTSLVLQPQSVMLLVSLVMASRARADRSRRGAGLADARSSVRMRMLYSTERGVVTSVERQFKRADT
jgi:hypothetical protein